MSFINLSFDPEALDGQHSTNIQYAIENIQSLYPQWSFCLKHGFNNFKPVTKNHTEQLISRRHGNHRFRYNSLELFIILRYSRNGTDLAKTLFRCVIE